MNPAEFWTTPEALRHVTPEGATSLEAFDVLAYLRRRVADGETVLDFGCGDARLAPAFDAERYVGVDINPYAIARCRERFPERRFELVGGELPRADVAIAYTVLLHVPDDGLADVVAALTAAAGRVLVAEILGRHWRGPHDPPVFNRDAEDYAAAFRNRDFGWVDFDCQPYARYGGALITVMEFRRGRLRDAP